MAKKRGRFLGKLKTKVRALLGIPAIPPSVQGLAKKKKGYGSKRTALDWKATVKELKKKGVTPRKDPAKFYAAATAVMKRKMNKAGTKGAEKMPPAMLPGMAKKAGKSLKKAEGYWKWAKAEVKKRYKIGPKKESDRYWSLVTALTKRRLGLKKESFEQQFAAAVEAVREGKDTSELADEIMERYQSRRGGRLRRALVWQPKTAVQGAAAGALAGGAGAAGGLAWAARGRPGLANTLGPGRAAALVGGMAGIGAAAGAVRGAVNRRALLLYRRAIARGKKPKLTGISGHAIRQVQAKIGRKGGLKVPGEGKRSRAQQVPV